MLLMVESTTGVYLAVLIARLVTLYSRSLEGDANKQTQA